MIILDDLNNKIKSNKINEDYKRFLNKYYDKLLKANKGDIVKTNYEIYVLYKALKKAKRGKENEKTNKM